MGVDSTVFDKANSNYTNIQYNINEKETAWTV